MSLYFSLDIEVDTGGDKPHHVNLCDENITHNLNEMADKAGIYTCLWRPDENGFKTAKDIIGPLTEGLQALKSKPEYFEKFNSPNGWGLYKHFVPFVERILECAIEHPNAIISVSL